MTEDDDGGRHALDPEVQELLARGSHRCRAVPRRREAGRVRRHGVSLLQGRARAGTGGHRGDGRYRCPRVLADAWSAARRRRNGQQIPAELATAGRSGRPLWLAGGLGPDNVGEVIDVLSPELIDASSGLEESPGQQDPGSSKVFFEEIRKHMKRYNDFFGSYGGRYVAEMLRAPAGRAAGGIPGGNGRPRAFTRELEETLRDFAGRPTPASVRGATPPESSAARAIYIKLEGLAHTGAHKINNAVGQALLARRMGKTRIIAETGAGQHGVATAAVCARLGIPCRVYMGEVDMRRQRPNVFWMERYGAEVVPVTSGLGHAEGRGERGDARLGGELPHHALPAGLRAGPSPYPDMVREFQSVIGRELGGQMQEKGVDRAALVACVGGGSNAIGFFSPFLETAAPELIGVEAGGRGSGTGRACRADERPGPRRDRAGLQVAVPRGRRRPAPAHPFHLRRPGLPGHRAAARPPRGNRAGSRFTTASDAEALEAVRVLRPDRGHDLRAGVGARGSRGHEAGAGLPAGQGARGEHVGPRGQGPVHPRPRDGPGATGRVPPRGGARTR